MKMGMSPDDVALDRRLREEVLAEPIDASSVERRVRRAIAPRLSHRILAGGGVAAMLVLGALTLSEFNVWSRPAPLRLCSDAARDHTREIVQQQPRHWSSNPASIEVLAQRSGIRSGAFSKLAFPGYRLDRGKLCVLSGRVFLHLVYSSGSQEFSLFLARGSYRNDKLYGRDFSGEYTASIETNRMRAVVVTSQSSTVAMNLIRIAAGAL